MYNMSLIQQNETIQELRNGNKIKQIKAKKKMNRLQNYLNFFETVAGKTLLGRLACIVRHSVFPQIWKIVKN